MAHLYRKYLRLLEKWPRNPSKNSYDLSQHIRDQVKITFSSPDRPLPSEEECMKIYESLNRIADNNYQKLFERNLNSSATGLTARQCKDVLADDFLEFLKKDSSSILSRLLNGK